MWFKIIHAPFIRVNAIALFPFILVRKKLFKSDPTLLRHEKIHLGQQLELLLLPFYLLYAINYLVNLARYKKHWLSYRNIIFEKEAFEMEAESDYLTHRKPYAWLHFRG